MSELTVERYPVEKTKVRSADIVVHGTHDKPYYEIKYQTTDGEWHIGYSSRKLEMVFGWLNECFEIVSYEQEIREKAIEEFVKQIKDWQDDIYDNERNPMAYDFVFDRIYEIAKQKNWEELPKEEWWKIHN